MGVVETFAIILTIAGSAVVVGFLLLAHAGFIVSPKHRDPAPGVSREPELLCELDRIGAELALGFWDRYHELVAKRESESLVPDGPEHQELIQMTDTLEEWNARRMGLLFELAKLRNTPIDEVMEEFRRRVGAHG